MMCGLGGEVGTDTGATRIRNNNNHHRDAIFREEQTDLLSVFQRHHYDLLAGNPPSHNPDFFPGSEQWLAGRSTTAAAAASSSSSSSSSSPVANVNTAAPPPSSHAGPDVAVWRHHHHQQQQQSSRNAIASAFAGINPFDDLSDVPSSNIRNARNFSGSLSTSQGFPGSERFTPSLRGGDGIRENANANATRAAPPFPLAAAAAIAVSDYDDDSAIPFVAALRIDDGGGDVVNEHDGFGFEPQGRQMAAIFGRSPPANASGFPQEPDMVEAVVTSVQRPPPLIFSPSTSTTRASRDGGLELPTTREAEGRNSYRNEGRRPLPPLGRTNCRPPPLVFFPEEFGASPSPSLARGRRTDERHSTEERPASGGGLFAFGNNPNPFGNDKHNNSNRSRNNTNSSRSLSSGNCINWSRISVHARAAAGEATRSLKKKLVKESKKLTSSKALLPRRRW
jgi:hypothetical protein